VLTKRKLVGLAAFGAMVLPTSATAQVVTVDPPGDSPAGKVYELPLDSARNDAAPKRPSKRKEDSPSNATGTGSGGDSGTGAGTIGTGSGGDSGGGGPTSAIRSENGFGSSDAVPGADDTTATPATTARATKAAVDDDPSSAGVYLLLGLVLLVAVALGITTRALPDRAPPGS
jgi:hypothetical protein